MSHKSRTPLLLALTLILGAGCSGGDGSVPGFIDNSPSGSADLATITADSAPAVAGVAAQQILEANFVSTLTTTGIPVTGSGSAAAQDMLRLSGPSLPSNLGAAQMTLVQCQASGTMDVTFTVADPNTISQGDVFSIQFDACDNGDGSLISGGLTMTVSGIAGDPDTEQFLLSLALDLDAFSVMQNGMTSGASGTVNLSIDSRQPTITTVTVSASALTFTNGGISETMTDLSITVVEDQSVFPPAVSVEQSFILSTPRLGGDIIVSTTIALERSGEEYPYDGEFTVTGDAGASVTVIALGPNSVRLEVDIDGDGATDVTVDTTWTEILAQAG